MTTITFTANLRSEHRRERTPVDPPKPRPASDRAARQLALAHHVERLIEDGVLRDYADAARVLGVSKARVSQIMDLLGLPAATQEGMLLGVVRVSERRMRGGKVDGLGQD